jgi:hypothetical protein
VTDEDGRAAIHRIHEISRPGVKDDYAEVVVRLDRVSPDQVAAEARELGFLTEPHMHVPETEEYLGSAVVMLRAP